MNQGKSLLESVDLNSIEEPANTRNTKPIVRLGCSFHELWGQPYFCFPLPDPVLQVRVCRSDFFLTSQIGYPLNLIVYSKTCLKRPLKKIQKIVCFFKTDYRIMQVKSIAECSQRAFCNTFDLHLSPICLNDLCCVYL